MTGVRVGFRPSAHVIVGLISAAGVPACAGPERTAEPPVMVDVPQTDSGAARPTYLDEVERFRERACACPDVECVSDAADALDEFDEDGQPQEVKDAAEAIFLEVDACIRRMNEAEAIRDLDALLDRLCACEENSCKATLASRAFMRMNSKPRLLELNARGELEAQRERLERCGAAVDTED